MYQTTTTRQESLNHQLQQVDLTMQTQVMETTTGFEGMTSKWQAMAHGQEHLLTQQDLSSQMQVLAAKFEGLLLASSPSASQFDTMRTVLRETTEQAKSTPSQDLGSDDEREDPSLCQWIKQLGQVVDAKEKTTDVYHDEDNIEAPLPRL